MLLDHLKIKNEKVSKLVKIATASVLIGISVGCKNYIGSDNSNNYINTTEKTNSTYNAYNNLPLDVAIEQEFYFGK